jgi:plastocyanin/uncharacterized membrane protein YozB (DUF420 family)
VAASGTLAARRPLWHYWAAALAAVLGAGAILVLALALSGTGQSQPGFLGTNARLLTDLNLVLQAVMAAALVVGVVLVRRGNVRAHQYTMTLVVLFNLVLIAFVMGGAFFTQVLPDQSPAASPQRLTPMLHGIAGAVAEGLGIYLILLMHSLLPAPLRASNYRLLMRLTFGLWLLVFAGGATMYVTTYTGSTPATNAPAAPAAAARPSGAGAYGSSAGTGAGAYGGVAGAGASAVQPTVAPARQAPVAVTVSMTNFAFGPKELTVKAGTTVSFTNGDRAPHTATADGGQFDTGNIAPGASGTITLSQPGTFRFFCRLHGSAGGQGMSGTVTVQP